MKFTVSRLVFLLLEVEASSVLDATIAIPNQNEAAHPPTLGKSTAIHEVTHMSAQSTIPTKITHAHQVSSKPKVAITALAGVKKSDGSKPVSPKRRKSFELGKSFNKSNLWGLYDAKANDTEGGHATASATKVHANSSTKQVTTTAPNHTKVASKEPKKPQTSKSSTSNEKVSKFAVTQAVPKEIKSTHTTAANKAVTGASAVAKAVPKEVKSTKPPAAIKTTHADKTVSHVAATAKAAPNTPHANKTVSHATAIVKAAPSTPHVLVNSKSQSHTNSAAAIAAENKAEYQLLNFLATESQMGKKDLPPFEVYLPACLEHLHNLIDNLDMAYTDTQLHSVLVDECWLKKSFPKSYDSSFSTDAACKKFADQLMNARYLELVSGSQEGYEGFCADYYVHIGGSFGKKAKAEAPPPKPKNTQSFPWHFVVVAAVILILFLIIVCMVAHKRRANAA